MDTSIRFFDEAARVGAVILQTLGPSTDTQKVITYLEKIEDIYLLMMKIHDEIVDVIIQANYTKNIAGIKKVLKGIEYGALEHTFRANKWCDELQELGIALRPLGYDAHLVGADREIWEEFCTTLERREGEVADLYDKKLWDLRQLPYRMKDVELLKQMLDVTATELVAQKAKFDLLARKAKTMRTRLG